VVAEAGHKVRAGETILAKFEGQTFERQT